jgi:hypothetical protein
MRGPAVLQRLAVGGGMNQYDDAIEPYLSLTRALYKDLVTVNKSAGGALQVSSLTFLVESVRGDNAQLFPRASPHNFCYVCVDPAARHVKLWYAAPDEAARRPLLWHPSRAPTPHTPTMERLAHRYAAWWPIM